MPGMTNITNVYRRHQPFGPRWTIIAWYTAWTAYLVASLLTDVLYYTQPMSAWGVLSVSNWTITLVTCSATVNCVAVIYVHAHRPETANGCTDRLPWYMRLQWVLTTTSSTSVLLVATLYWAVGGRSVSHSSINKHVAIVIYALVKTIFISSKPVRLFHFVQPVIIGLCYIIVSLVCQMTTSEGATYYLLDWRAPQRSVPFSICILVLAIPMVHSLFYTIHRLRIFIFKKYFDESHSTSSTCSLQKTVHRGVTATDVMLHEEPTPVELEVPTECKDDMDVRVVSNRNNELFPRLDARHSCSENDLRDYTMKNGFYCDFARSSQILHHGRCGIFGSETCEHINRRQHGGNQLIVVEECADNKDAHFPANSTSVAATDYVSNTTADDAAIYL